MKKPILLLIVAIIPILVSCAEQKEDKQFSGRYIWGAEVNTFSPCSSELDYWVATTQKIQTQLTAKHQELTNKPYEAVFAQLTGIISEVPENLKNGFPGDYDGLITVESVTEIRALKSQDCAK